MTLGLFGKHPSFGDFVSAGLADGVEARLQPWLDSALTGARDILAGEWDQIYDGSAPIRFWIGPDVFDTSAFDRAAALSGVFFAFRDQVGRRYPLMVMRVGQSALPPVIDLDQGFYEAVETAVLQEADPAAGAAGLLARIGRLVPPDPAEGYDLTGTLWATNARAGLGRLLTDVAQADHMRAVAGRTYWWGPDRNQRAAIFLSEDGAPNAESLVWLLREATREAERIRPVEDHL